MSVARVKVSPDREPEYLAAIRELAALAARRNQQIWVFRSRQDPQTFLEFSESPTTMSHRNVASRTPDELRLEQRLHNAAAYDHTAADLWEEVPLAVATSEETEH
ncbi:MAG: hypothetical protein ABI836_01250 [Gemmatimonadota bacterium]